MYTVLHDVVTFRAGAITRAAILTVMVANLACDEHDPSADEGSDPGVGTILRLVPEARAISRDATPFVVYIELIKPAGVCWTNRHDTLPSNVPQGEVCDFEQSVQTTIQIDGGVPAAPGSGYFPCNVANGVGALQSNELCAPLGSAASSTSTCDDPCCTHERVRYTRPVWITPNAGETPVTISAVANHMSADCTAMFAEATAVYTVLRSSPELDSDASATMTASTTTDGMESSSTLSEETAPDSMSTSSPTTSMSTTETAPMETGTASGTGSGSSSDSDGGTGGGG